jgi:hypothetical protein
VKLSREETRQFHESKKWDSLIAGTTYLRTIRLHHNKLFKFDFQTGELVYMNRNSDIA